MSKPQNPLATRGTERLLQIRSSADPEATLLLKVRSFLQKDEAARNAFLQAAGVADRVQGLVNHFQTEWPDTPVEALVEVATYLVDEQQQVQPGALLISSSTGRALMQLQEKDVWQPPPVPRESGAIVHPEARLQPALESALVQWVFDTEREKQIVQELACRLPQTPLTQETGDRRLFQVTRTGRKQIVDELRASLPDLLTQHTSGVVAAFLGRVPVVKVPQEGAVGGGSVSRAVQERVLLADLKSLNLRYDPLQAMQAKIAAGWVRAIARAVAEVGVQKGAPRVTVEADDLQSTLAHRLLDAFWVAPPDVACCYPEGVDRMLVVEGSPVVVIPSDAVVSCVVDPTAYTCEGRDVFERWEVTAGLTFQVHANWESLLVLDVRNVPLSGVIVETPGSF